jgi:phosphoglycerate dehydrogenase-like enzyme
MRPDVPDVKVALLSRIVRGNAAAMRRLEAAGVEVVLDLPGYEALDEREWHAVAAGIDGLVVGLQPVDQAFLTAARRLRYVVRVGTGLDNIDLDAARERGVAVEALAGLNAPAVAEYAFALLLAAAKRIPEVDADVRAGRWGRRTGRHLGGRTLGLVGYGDIARAMVPKAQGFGMDVLVHRRRASADTVTLEELLRRSDFVSLHAPLTEETRGMIGRREIDLMDGTVLVNTARGELVDEAALRDGLVSGKVAAAGLDVFADEPPAGSPLLDAPNVVLSSHNAGYSDQALETIAAAAVDRLLAALTTPRQGVR